MTLKTKFELALTLITIALIGAAVIIMTSAIYAPSVDNHVQSTIDIYHHFTVYSEDLSGTVYTTEIDVDNTLAYPCDGQISDDNGHNCVIVGDAEIRQILTDYNLINTYPHTKGE